MLQLHKMLGL